MNRIPLLRASAAFRSLSKTRDEAGLEQESFPRVVADVEDQNPCRAIGGWPTLSPNQPKDAPSRNPKHVRDASSNIFSRVL